MVSVLVSVNVLIEKQKSTEVEVKPAGLVRPTQRSWAHACPPPPHPKSGLLEEARVGAGRGSCVGFSVSFLW